MKNFLITGASGFIGNNFLKNFSNKKNYYYIFLKSSKKNKKLSIGSLIHDAKRYGIDGFFKNDKKSIDVVVGEYPKKKFN